MGREIEFEYSKGAVNRAGAKLATGAATDKDLQVIENWRAAHNHVLNTFQANLRKRTKHLGNRSPVQRIKRLTTIKGKLRRFPKMQLSRMHDVVGCRVIFENHEALVEFRDDFNRSRFEHKRRFKVDADGKRIDAYNYIENPKLSGYRGIHDVFEYKAKQGGRARSAGGHKWNGHLIEIQYRTRVQHAWATAVEICDTYTDNHGKFSKAPDEYLEYFGLASEVLARSAEEMTSCYPDLTNKEIVSRFLELEAKHGMLRTLRGIQPANPEFKSNKHALLIIKGDGRAEDIEVTTFSNFKTAVTEYFRQERETLHDIVLVAADDSESVRFGFKNYFSDAREFVDLVDVGLKKLRRR